MKTDSIYNTVMGVPNPEGKGEGKTWWPTIVSPYDSSKRSFDLMSAYLFAAWHLLIWVSALVIGHATALCFPHPPHIARPSLNPFCTP